MNISYEDSITINCYRFMTIAVIKSFVSLIPLFTWKLINLPLVLKYSNNGAVLDSYSSNRCKITSLLSSSLLRDIMGLQTVGPIQIETIHFKLDYIVMQDFTK